MQRLKNFAISIVILALVALPSTTSSQNQQNSSESSPQRTSQTVESQGPQKPPAKFMRTTNRIPNRYIVVLDDDIVPDNLQLEVRRERVAAIANSHAQMHGGAVDFIYETALKGYAIELPNEAAAIAISKSPRVKWVEEDALGEWDQAPPSPQASPPWGLDAIDGSIPTATPDTTGRTNGLYLFNANGSGVSAYVLDSGINTQHQAFLTPFFSRASEAADCFTFVNCQSGQMTPFFNQQACVFPMPNSSNNDCHGHGTHVAGIVGGNTYGVAKNVTIKSVKIGSTSGPILSAVIAGVNWVTSDHQANSSIPAVANMSLALPTGSGVETAVQNSIAAGVTYVVAAGNFNDDARNIAPADVADALTVGAVDWNLSRWIVNSFQGSNWGPGVDLFAPGVFVVSALTGNFLCTWNGSNTSECAVAGTSMAAPHVAGAVAMYLQGRPGVTGCGLFPIQGVAPASGNLSTCADRVARFIKATANLNRLNSNINGTTTDANGNQITVPSPNRFLWNIWSPTNTNPIDNHQFFIWTQYEDFLNREPDNGGLQFYVNILQGCGSDVECINYTRGALSANFFRSPEFGGRGGYIANLFNIVFGQRPKTVAELSDPTKVERPHYNEFIADLQFISAPTDAQVNLLKSLLATAWLGRSEVQQILPGSLTNTQFVQKLESTAGVTLANESTLIANLNNGSQSRAQVLRAVAESNEVTARFHIQNFVTMKYIGHLRREPENCHGTPDPANCGYIFHYNRYITLGLDPDLTENIVTRGFIESPEYRRRFGPN
jgi:subtilisin family serine protease